MDEDDSKIFPQRLMECLSDRDSQNAISWLPHGKAFIIHNRSLFAEMVMPKYFSRKAKYSSFTRKLNRWNFSRVASGPELGAYHHEFFLRDKPHLSAQMFCKNARTMLALASASEEKIEPQMTPFMPSRSEDELTPIPFHNESPPADTHPIQPYAMEFAPKWDGCYEKNSAHGFPDVIPYGGASSLQMLEQQMNYMQQMNYTPQQEHQQFTGQHLQPPPQQMYNHMPPFQVQNNHEQFMQMQQMMQLGMQHQRTRQPTSKRANAA